MAPYVWRTYLEELHKLEQFVGVIYPSLAEYGNITSYEYTELSPQMTDVERVKATAVNNTVSRVHQAMESFIHNCNNIHSRGGELLIAPR